MKNQKKKKRKEKDLEFEGKSNQITIAHVLFALVMKYELLRVP